MEMASASFVSYSRGDSDFALRLAEDLKAAGANVWLDQTDILPGRQWDRAVEEALDSSPRILVVLSPAAVDSTNVMDEVSFALEKKKTVIPIIYRDCAVPFRLRRLQHVDFRSDYARALQILLKTLGTSDAPKHSAPASPQVSGPIDSRIQPAHRPATEEQRPSREDESNVVAEVDEKPEVVGRAQDVVQQAAEAGREERPGSESTDSPREQRREDPPGVQQERSPDLLSLDEATTTVADSGPANRLHPEFRRVLAIGLLLLVVTIIGYVIADNGKREPLPAKSDEKSPDVWVYRTDKQESLSSIATVADGNRLWATAFNGTILISTDRATTWRARDTGMSNRLTAIHVAADGTRMVAVGWDGTILKSVDGGNNWSRRTSGIRLTEGIPRPAEERDDTRDDFSAIFGTGDSQHLWAVTEGGEIVRSRDGGEKWRPVGTEYRLQSIWGTRDGKRLWVVGSDGTILKSEDSGETWSTRASGTREWLYSIVGLSNGERLWTVGDNGTILHSSDSGETWRSQDSMTTQRLHSISVDPVGNGAAWAVGTGGTVLSSSDYGEHWRLRRSGTKEQLRSIAATGEGDSLQGAWVVGDRGTLLKVRPN